MKIIKGLTLVLFIALVATWLGSLFPIIGSAVFAIIFGKKISKAQQLTNWENSHLTDEQARYASTDAWATLSIYLALQQVKPLSKRAVEALKRAEKEAQIRRQQEAMAKKCLEDAAKAATV